MSYGRLKSEILGFKFDLVEVWVNVMSCERVFLKIFHVFGSFPGGGWQF